MVEGDGGNSGYGDGYGYSDSYGDDGYGIWPMVATAMIAVDHTKDFINSFCILS